MDLKSVYESLLNYQEILKEKFKFENDKDELPKVLSSKIEVQNRVKSKYRDKYTEYKRLKDNLENYNKVMNEIDMHETELSEKLKYFKTQKEYEAYEKELAGLKNKRDDINFNILNDKRMLEELENDIENFEISIKLQDDEITKEKERVNVKVEEIQKELEKINEKVMKITGNIDDDLRYKFEKIVKNKDGNGIVTVTKGHCNGCYLILPAEYINMVRSNDTINFCPNCSRVLYFDETPDSIFTLDEEEMDDSEFFDLDE